MKQKEQEININKKNDTQTFHDKLKICIDTMEDPRAKDNQKYPFFSVIGIILCAVISGANSVSAICNYAKAKYEWLKTWLNLPDSPPGYLVFWWMLVRLDPTQCEILFNNWVDNLTSEDIEDIIAIDGKRVKGASKKKKKKQVHCYTWSVLGHRNEA